MSIFGNIASAIFGTKGVLPPVGFSGSIVICVHHRQRATERRIGRDGKADVTRRSRSDDREDRQRAR